MPVNRLTTVLPIGLFFFVLAGCASAPQPAEHAAGGVGDRAAQNAAQLVGKPYRYGGASPSTGFDCSGLVQWSYAQAGRKLPRSTDDQRASSGKHVRRDRLDAPYWHKHISEARRLNV
jgi:cell wall-associated NlpC family hydrolase